MFRPPAATRILKQLVLEAHDGQPSKLRDASMSWEHYTVMMRQHVAGWNAEKRAAIERHLDRVEEDFTELRDAAEYHGPVITQIVQKLDLVLQIAVTESPET
jgi:hypothetical protein